MTTLRVGLHLPEAERVVPWTEICQISRTAEAVGFDSLWVPDHLLYRGAHGEVTGPWECWSILSAVASVTERVEIGPLVLCTSFRNPGLIAKMAATVDEISGGRLILGLGAGWNEPEYEAFGFPYETRFAEFREAFDIVAALLRDGFVDHVGEHFTLRDCELCPLGPRPERIPLMIGSKGPQMLRHTLPHVQYWNGWCRWWGNKVERLPALLEAVDAAAVEAGRDPATIEKTVAIFVRLEGGCEPDNPEAPHVQGDTGEIVALLHRYAGMGIGHVQIILDPLTLDGVERFGRVLEELR
jgi:alkanesulfonate monooxygenase SsuD/methylene tetrahydromethanopterin reductase-like flavin-dependent oxidoreductase (luciferase family)